MQHVMLSTILAACGITAAIAGMSTGPEERAVITHSGSDPISIIDAREQMVMATPMTGQSPHGVAISPGGGRIYVTNENANSVTILDSTGTVITHVPVGQRPNQVGITPDGRWVYVTVWGEDRVDIIDARTTRVVKRLAVGRNPHIALPAPDGNVVYVTNESSNSISVVDTRTQAVTRTISLYGFPRVIAITPDGDTLFATMRWVHSTLIVDTASGEVTGRIDLPTTRGFSADGKYAHGLAVTPDGKEVWVASQLNHAVYLYAVDARNLLATIPTGRNPNWVAFTQDGRLAYISNTSSNDVTVVDAVARTVVTTVTVGSKPKRLAVGAVGTGTVKQTWSFDKDPARRLAAGWAEITGAWQVVADSTAPSPPNALAQASRKHTGSYFSVAIANEPSLKDVVIRVQMRAVSGQEDRGGGPVWRYRDIDNYYVARHNPLEDNYRVYKVVNGRRIQLGSADLKATAGAWHELKITMTGNMIQCFFDGKKYLDVKDNAFQEPGRVGLWTKADAHTYFDDFQAEGK